MTDETRIIRTVGIPLVVAFVLLFALPKMCARAVTVSKARREAQIKDLSIESTSTEQLTASSTTTELPPGLDVDRVRYYVEADAHFSEPYTSSFSRATSPDKDGVLPVLNRLGYVASVGGYNMITRDGTLKIDGLRDEGGSWSLRLAQRRFDKIKSVRTDEGKLLVVFSWKWDTTPVGAELLKDPKPHDALASFTGGDNHWDFVEIRGLEKALK